MTIKGLVFRPISQYDPMQYPAEYETMQYAGRTVPHDANRASGAAVLTMIARTIKPGFEITIDQFARPDDGFDWRGNGQNPALTRFTFSDGKGGAAVEPTGDNAFPLTAETDIVPMLRDGPVMLGGVVSVEPPVTHWVLAMALAPGGTGIVANDPRSGQQVILGYDASTKTVGGIRAVFNRKTQSWLPVNEANARQITTDTWLPTSDFPVLQGFVPTRYYAVTIK